MTKPIKSSSAQKREAAQKGEPMPKFEVGATCPHGKPIGFCSYCKYEQLSGKSMAAGALPDAEPTGFVSEVYPSPSCHSCGKPLLVITSYRCLNCGAASLPDAEPDELDAMILEFFPHLANPPAGIPEAAKALARSEGTNRLRQFAEAYAASRDQRVKLLEQQQEDGLLREEESSKVFWALDEKLKTAERQLAEAREALIASVPFLFEYGSHAHPHCYRGSDDGCYCGLTEAKRLVEAALCQSESKEGE